MTTRERTIAKFAIPLMVVCVLYWMGTKLADSPLGALGGQLAALQEEFDDKVKEREAAEHYVMRYRRLYEMVMAEDGDEESVSKNVKDRTKGYIRRKIDNILADVKLTVESKQPPVLTKGGGKGRKKKLDFLTYTVVARGELKDIMQFLLDLYRLDDLLYVSSVDLRPDKRQHSSKVGATIKIQTLIIPHKKKWDKLVAGAKPEPPPDEDGKHKMGRLGATTMAAYDIFQNWRPFDPVRPDEPEIPDVATSGPRDFQDRDLPRNGPESDPERDAMIVRAFINDSVMVVKKSARPRGRGRSRSVREPERTWFDLGEEFDGGTLELVHRLGLLVSKTKQKEGEEGEEEGGEEGGEQKQEEESESSELWAYQYGESFSESRLLDELIKEFGEFRQLLWAWQETHEAEQVGPPAPDNGIKLQAQGDKEAAQESSNELSKSSN